MSLNKFIPTKLNLEKEIQKDQLNVDKTKTKDFQIIKGGISKNMNNKLVEGVRYIDSKNKRLVFKLNNKLYFSNLQEL